MFKFVSPSWKSTSCRPTVLGTPQDEGSPHYGIFAAVVRLSMRLAGYSSLGKIPR
jgi:hypothetical protein